jgi:hypothetical protein
MAVARPMPDEHPVTSATRDGSAFVIAFDMISRAPFFPPTACANG